MVSALLMMITPCLKLSKLESEYSGPISEVFFNHFGVCEVVVTHLMVIARIVHSGNLINNVIVKQVAETFEDLKSSNQKLKGGDVVHSMVKVASSYGFELVDLESRKAASIQRLQALPANATSNLGVSNMIKKRLKTQPKARLSGTTCDPGHLDPEFEPGFRLFPLNASILSARPRGSHDKANH
ncbi:hypothetical protein VNO77_27457 [Canavalia gladiata]|uniref:Uncharacterized protein n=1 Tax=Canavalia gladiata TaxID=3824 RepID=A0AAN9KXB3_CANGL